MRSRSLALVALLGAGTTACGTSSERSGLQPLDGSTSPPDGSSGGELDAGPLAIDATAPSDGPTGCVGTLQDARLTPFDLYTLIDKSGSMAWAGGEAVSRWSSMKVAMTEFVRDPKVADVGLGLQYYALRSPGVPDTCTSDADCGSGVECSRNKFCSDQSDRDREQCETDADCDTPGATCLTIGSCGYNSSGPTCLTPGEFCDNGHLCHAPPRTCGDFYSCDPDLYATPQVAIAPIGRHSQALLESVYTTAPEGPTPLGPALEGALSYATGWARDNPERPTGVLVVSDGDFGRNVCNSNPDTEIAQARDAFERDGVRTFVIGILGNNSTNTPKIDFITSLAEAGGGAAFFADPSADLARQFGDALTNIRRESIIPCRFQLPEPPTNQSLDYFRVNLEFTTDEDSASETIFYVEDAQGCDETAGGWYYDVRPEDGTPRQIVTCPATCERFEESLTGRADLRVGCEVEVPR